jgi:hypothetical protein
MLNMNNIVGDHDIVFITIDALRYDIAQAALEDGDTPNLRRAMQGALWQQRHSPGSFTLAAHQAFFAGFLPTPTTPGVHPRLFALRFGGSQTTVAETFVFDAPDIVNGFAALGYHTICIGGVGFFNKQSPLGNVLPSLFKESHWQPQFGVTDARSSEHQVAKAIQVLSQRPRGERVFLFINFSAVHQPNRLFLQDATSDSIESHRAALLYVDSCLPPLFSALVSRGRAFCIVCSDHGTAYGDDGYWGHRLAHSTVWTVPYTEFFLVEGQSW